MRNALFLSALFFPLFLYAQSQKIIDMQGMTDAHGITRLVFRAGPEFSRVHADIIDTDVYVYNTASGISDTLFRAVTDPAGERGEIIGPLAFWDNDPDKFIRYFNPYPDYTPGLIETYFSDTLIRAPGTAHYSGYPLIISTQNPARVYLSKTDSLFVSADSGISWDALHPAVILIAVNPFDERYLYAVNDQQQLLFSSDTGNTFVIADDNAVWNIHSQMEFDKDGMHIYATGENDNANYLIVSDDKGKPFTWEAHKNDKEILSAWYEDVHVYLNNYYNIAVDDSLEGTLFHGTGSSVFINTDFGSMIFEPYAEFYSQISGIYKKPATDRLYVATSYFIEQFDSSSCQTLIQITPEDIHDFYPLQKGDQWIYSVNGETCDLICGGFSFELSFKVLKDTLMNDGRLYKKIKRMHSGGTHKFTFVRYDSASQSVIYYENEGALIPPPNLYGIPGDMLAIGEYETLLFMDESPSMYWGNNFLERIYQVNSLAGEYYKLVKGLGLTLMYSGFDFGYSKYELRGSVINGIVYGDTTFVVSAGDEVGHPSKFALNQNYPNPFNPLTTINYWLKNRDKVVIKVYDMSGKELRTLVNNVQPAGKHSLQFDASALASGIYLYRMEAAAYSQTRKMLLLK